MKGIGNSSIKPISLVILALLLAASLRAWLVAGGWAPFNSDEAVVALMARHILQGARPSFFYGQAYMGSLDAFLAAGAFAIFGQQVWAIRLVQGLLYLGVMLTTAWLGVQAFQDRRVPWLSMLLLALPTVNVTLYTTVSLGGYGEALLLGNLILLCALKIRASWRVASSTGAAWLWLAFGFLCGMGLWVFGLTLVYSLSALLFLALSAWREQRGKAGLAPRAGAAAGLMFFGALLGSAPWWIFAIKNGLPALLSELGGSAIAGVEGLPWIMQTLQHALNLLLFGSTVTFGLRPPWGVTWLALPLLPFVLLFWMAVLVYILRCLRTSSPWRSAQALLAGVMLALLAAFVLTPFGADPSGRYFLPLAIPLSLFAAALILELERRIGKWAYSLAALILVYNLWGTVQSALRFPPGFTTQFYQPTQVDRRYDLALIDFLRQQGEWQGYGNYWVTYPLAFLSGEELIYVPRLPYHLDFRYTARDDRFQPYAERVASAERVAYITTNHPDLDEYLRARFDGLGVAFQEVQIGDYHVFYALSRPIQPQEIGLGETTVP
jgi:4-amino-4-deoxy-L-arabinose transferase-like glycosyltransferase